MLSNTFQTEMIAFLKGLPNIQLADGRRALIAEASLDPEVVAQLNFDSPPAQFFPLLVETLTRYGTMPDGRNALAAVLEAACNHVGADKQPECERLVRAAQTLRPGSKIRAPRRFALTALIIILTGLAGAAILWWFRGGSLPLAGVILDQRGKPLPGVTVTLKEFPVEAVTDQWGKFALHAPTREQMTVRLLFRKPGCEKSPQDATLGNTTLTVKMQCQP